MRADARRNRDRLLEVAEQAFADDGPAVPVPEIARRAGIGVGTVYRHFPTKEALLGAIILRRIEQLTDLAEQAAGDEDAAAGFAGFVGQLVQAGSGNKAIAAALTRGGVDLAQLTGEPGRRLNAAIERLLARAQDAGTVRDDVGARELKVLTNGLIQAAETYPDDPGMALRLVPVLLAGLRPPDSYAAQAPTAQRDRVTRAGEPSGGT
jgi:AcrR family transcriptional regulator